MEMAALGNLWKEVCETERRSSERNEQLTRQLDELEECFRQIATKTGEMRRVRERYITECADHFHEEPLTSSPIRRTEYWELGHSRAEGETHLSNGTHTGAHFRVGPPLTPNTSLVHEKVDSLPPSGSRRTSISSVHRTTRRPLAQSEVSTFVRDETFPNGTSSALLTSPTLSKFIQRTGQTDVDVSEQSEESVSVERRKSAEQSKVIRPHQTPSRDSGYDRESTSVRPSLEPKSEGSGSAVESKRNQQEEDSPKRESSVGVAVPIEGDTGQCVGLKNDCKWKGDFSEESVSTASSRGGLPANGEEIVAATRTQSLTVTSKDDDEDEGSLYGRTNSAFVFDDKVLDVVLHDTRHPSGTAESSDEDDIERQMSAAKWTTRAADRATSEPTKGERQTPLPRREEEDKKVDPSLTRQLVERMGLLKLKGSDNTEQVNGGDKDDDDEFDFYD